MEEAGLASYDLFSFPLQELWYAADWSLSH